MKFKNNLTAEIVRYIEEIYGIKPDFLWRKTPNDAAFRHTVSKKWFGVLLLDTPKKKLGLDCDGKVDILDLKCDQLLIGSLLAKNGYLPGYHMNKEHWITVLMDGSVSADEIFMLIDMSYDLTKNKGKKHEQI